MNAQESYTHDGEWAGYKVRKTQRGYNVKFWSRIQGARDGLEIHLPAGFDGHYSMALAEDWNECMNRAQYVRDCARWGGRILRHGHIVE